MKFLKKLFHFYVFSNLHVAIAGFSLTRITEISYGIDNCFASLFVALSIVLSYNFIRYFEIKTDRLAWFSDWFNTNFIKIKILFVMSILGLLFLILNGYVSIIAMLFVIPFGIMAFFYVIPLFRMGEIDVSFRNLPYVKIFSISIAWAGVTAIFPIVNYGFELQIVDYLAFISRFLFVFSITLPFDIRDVHTDKNQLKTIPQIFGINAAKMIGAVSMVLIILLTYLVNESFPIDIILICILTILFLIFASPKRNIFYSSFFVESIPIIWLILITYFS